MVAYAKHNITNVVTLIPFQEAKINAYSESQLAPVRVRRGKRNKTFKPLSLMDFGRAHWDTGQTFR